MQRGFCGCKFCALLYPGYESSLITVYNGYKYYRIYLDASICVYSWCKLYSGYESSLIMVYNCYLYYRIYLDAYICVYALCRLYPIYESSLITVYNGYKYYHIDADASIFVYTWCMTLSHILFHLNYCRIIFWHYFTLEMPLNPFPVILPQLRLISWDTFLFSVYFGLIYLTLCKIKRLGLVVIVQNPYIYHLVVSRGLLAMVCLVMHENMIHLRLLRKSQTANQVLNFHYSIGLVHDLGKQGQRLHLLIRGIKNFINHCSATIERFGIYNDHEY